MAGGEPTKTIGRYAIYGPLAAGGMATVHLGRLVGPIGFSRTVAVKRMRTDHLADPDFVSMFVDEARIAGRIRHPNIVAVNDVVATPDELLLVMEYVHGETLAWLSTLSESEGGIPAPIAAAIVRDALLGLHAAHEAKDEEGRPLAIVHRDVSPQNIIVGVDGVARVLDFGIAKAKGRSQVTRDGQLKGKLAYMAPEQLAGEVTRATDTFAASIILWEALTGKRLFRGETDVETVGKVLSGPIPKPSVAKPELGTAYDEVVMKGLHREPRDRHASAREMATALGRVVELPDPSAVGEWVAGVAKDRLGKRASLVELVESSGVSKLPSEAPTETAIDVDTSFDAETRVPKAAPSRRWILPALGAAAAVAVVAVLAWPRVQHAQADRAPPPAEPASAAPIVTATATPSASVSVAPSAIPIPSATPVKPAAPFRPPPPRASAPPAPPKPSTPSPSIPVRL
jgi:serine/threonine-protein kinase